MTAFGYKLFESKDGILYPLFIDKKNPVPIGDWIPAEDHPTKKFAHRPGWHIGEIPDAPWLKGYDGTDSGLYRSRFSRGKRVWCIVEYLTDVDWTAIASQYPKGSMNDQIPKGGYYNFREIGNRNWIIAGEMRIVRILEEDERQQILKEMGYDEVAEYIPYKNKLEKVCQRARN